VKSVLDNGKIPVTIKASASLDEVLRIVTESCRSTFPVLNAAGDVIGIIPLREIRRAFLEPDVTDLVIASDIAISEFEPIHINDTLSIALRKLIVSGFDELPVINEREPRKILGMVSRGDVLKAYSTGMQKALSLKNS